MASIVAAVTVGSMTAAAAVEAQTFVEDFSWRGTHASFVNGGSGTTVFWNRDDWDVRNDTHQIAVTPFTQGLASDPVWNGHSTTIHKAKRRSAGSSALNDGVRRVGGDGSAGIGVMNVDFQGIASARLRNPVAISAAKPAIVSFRAPKFVTTGHWWEIAISPGPIGGENTAVPGRQEDGLNDPLTGQLATGGSTNGPGHAAVYEDSVNVIATGWPDAPTCDGQSWRTRFGVTTAIGGRYQHYVNPKGTIGKLVNAEPKKRRELRRWRLEFRPDGVKLFGAVRNKNKVVLVDQWNVDIPWESAYVHLLWVAYQSDHHPQIGCGYGRYGVNYSQNTYWRNVRVSPVTYSRTAALPGEAPEGNWPWRASGWMSYDLRDTEHSGGEEGGLPQPNPRPYDYYDTYAYCSPLHAGELICGDPQRSTDNLNLQLSMDATQIQGLRAAKLLADIRYPGQIAASVNGVSIGSFERVLEKPPALAGDLFEPEAWVRRSLEVPAGLLRAGTNTFSFSLSGEQVQLDRLELELGYGG